jgi:transcriptional regulator with XRE-family HTH domain
MTNQPVKLMLAEPADGGTVGSGIAPAPEVPSTRTVTRILTADIGWNRDRARFLHRDFDALHQRSHDVEWHTLAAERARSGASALLDELAAMGFAWRDVARLIGVSVPAVQKWRRGEGATGENRARLASLLAACDLISEHYLVEDIATWFEVPLVVGVPVTPLDLYAAERVHLVFEHAVGSVDPERLLTAFDPEWREHYRSNFEVFRAADGALSLRSRDDG